MNMLEQTLDFAGARRTPFIGQNEASECGLACMAMIANHHGHRTDLGALRQRFVLSLKGATLKQVMAIAEQLGFSSRPLRGEIDDLGDLVLPAVLHWDLTHYVVLTRIERGFGKTRYHIHDPAKGQLTLTRDELSRHFTGVILHVRLLVHLRADCAAVLRTASCGTCFSLLHAGGDRYRIPQL
jgi:ATP-binding cassette, subfamily B, bacterial CvaB/MchF/RaxB